ncbi:hypothetical protein [Actinomadura rupiterrae]|uniref:hypothetical protein n=1 Tax=Actinomadura rupiterrae TaxID=559627 RepID=UPI0020A52703|nr:hypothetical protein [Actinomadura rupiterrae]MCP2337928.1 hypothetical protein [Actinomadura rupiterrae]
MPPSDNLDSAKSGQELVEAYQRQLADQSGSRIPDRALISDMLTDLMHYCWLHGVNFDRAMEAARLTFAAERTDSPSFALDSTVELVGKAADQAREADLPFRGVITGIINTSGESVYRVRFPCVEHAGGYSENELRPGIAFRPVRTSIGLVRSPFDVERAIIATSVQVRKAAEYDRAPSPDQVRDLRELLGGLRFWSGASSTHRLEVLLSPRIEAAFRELDAGTTAATDGHPARLAAADGPEPDLTITPPEQGPHHAAPPPSQRPGLRPRPDLHP